MINTKAINASIGNLTRSKTPIAVVIFIVSPLVVIYLQLLYHKKAHKALKIGV